jgi:hypothetical protein
MGLRLGDAIGIKPVHEGATQPMGDKTGGERRSQFGGDAAPSGTDGEHSRPLAPLWVSALEETGWMGRASLNQCGLGPVSNGAGPN